MRSFRSSKFLKTTADLTITTQKQTFLVLGLLVLFWTGNTFSGKFGLKTENYQFKLNFCT